VIDLCQFLSSQSSYNSTCIYSEKEVMNFDMRSALFWDVTQRIVVISYPHFGTTYLSHFIGFLLEFLDP